MGCRNSTIESDDEGGYTTFANKDAPENRKEKSSQDAHMKYATEGSNNEGGAKRHASQTDIKEQTTFTSTENIVIEQNKNAMAVNGNGKNSAEDFKNQATEKKTTVNDNQNINTKDNDTKILERTQFDKHKAEQERNKELQQLKDQLQERNDKIKQLDKTTKTSERAMDEKNPVRPERNRLKREHDQLKTQFDKLTAENEEQKKELQQLKDQLQKGNDKIKQLVEKNNELEEEVKQTQDRCTKTLEGSESNRKMHIQLEKEKVELQKKFTDFERKANKKIERLNQEMNDLAKEKDKALVIKKNELRDVQAEKEDLLLRLSEMTGRRLTDNNANIADLSDQNRPTKLAEKYAELYDNEWTDAFSYLQTLDVSKDSEKRIIDILLTILVEAFTLSTKTAEKQLDTVRKTLEDFYGKTSQNRDQVQDLIKKLIDQRKKVTQPSIDLEKEYKVTVSRKIKDLPPSSLESEAFKPFVQKCLELCWLMAIQDPPLYLTLENCKTGQIFDRNTFKEYTKSGGYIEFVVWPAVFLEKGGPLLCKGVVQCKKSNSFQLRSKDGSQTGQRLAKSLYSKDTTVTLTSTLSLDSEKCNKSSSLTNASQVNDQSGNTKL
ncbi:titin homolog [Ruditapes philippinarum]|uniref:titin homolog n=1 Tax=Ruditapes philippinarum TaxID=129788 RepID=UPI00295BFF95|nr:titin homolog [Ruditapes philippinarum]